MINLHTRIEMPHILHLKKFHLRNYGRADKLIAANDEIYALDY